MKAEPRANSARDLQYRTEYSSQWPHGRLAAMTNSRKLTLASFMGRIFSL